MAFPKKKKSLEKSIWLKWDSRKMKISKEANFEGVYRKPDVSQKQ